MSTAGRPSSARAIARLAAEFVGLAALLFLTRFVARPHLIPHMDQECHIGGIAVDVLAHGLRFPLCVYAPNEYDNGSLFSGLLAALSFSLLGRSVLALKLTTHLIVAAGALAALWLLRGCLEDLRLTSRRARWTATTVLLVSIALAPRVVTVSSMYAVGNHAEGSAFDTMLLALFARRWHVGSAPRTAAFWAVVGLALYLNKGTVLVIPVLAAAELALARGSLRPVAAAVAGFALGVLPELLVVMRERGMGWATMATKAARGSHAFPHAFFDDLWTLSDHRIGLLVVWTIAVVAGAAWLIGIALRSVRARPAVGAATTLPGPSVTLGLAVGVSLLHLAALAFMAQGGVDAYVIYGFPTVVVLVSVLIAWACSEAAARRGRAAANVVAAGAVALTLLIHRPDAWSMSPGAVRALWNDRAAAACSWRFAEGFMREQAYGLAPAGPSRDAYAVQRCRQLSEPGQVLDCIGGIARELNWRQSGTVPGDPPAELTADERRAYAYHWGTHRRGNVIPCRQFTSPELQAQCTAAVELDCLVYGDLVTRYATGQSLGRPRCNIPEPPIETYWAARRADYLARPPGRGPDLTLASTLDVDLRACRPVFDACY